MLQEWVDEFIKEVDAVEAFLHLKLVEYEREFEKMANGCINKLIELGLEDKPQEKLLEVIEEKSEVFEQTRMERSNDNNVSDNSRSLIILKGHDSKNIS